MWSEILGHASNIIGHASNITTWGTTFSIGSIQYGQSKDFIIELDNQISGTSYLTATLKFRNPQTGTLSWWLLLIADLLGCLVCIEAEGNSIDNTNNCVDIQLLRSKFLVIGETAVEKGFLEGGNLIKELIKEIETSNVVDDSFVADLLQDLSGNKDREYSKIENVTR